ncbi:MAG: zinc ribbon domain-containing protein [Vicinamibacterales bacterium]
MPLYEFQCDACENRFERIQKYTDPDPQPCPTCGKGPVRRLPSSPAIQFKGSGFYITDYAKKSSTEASSAKSSGEGGGSSNSSASSSSSSSGEAKTESKSESKTETKSETKSTDAKGTDKS